MPHPQPSPLDYDRRCRAADRCREWELVDRHRVGAPINTDGGLCDTCTRHVAHVLSELPAIHHALHRQLAAASSTAATDVVAATRERPIPIRLDVDALQRDIVHTVIRWAEPVAERARLPYDTTRECSRQPDAALATGTAILAGHLSVLLAIRGHDGIEWRDNTCTYVTLDGPDGALTLAELYRRALLMCGTTTKTYRLPAPCPHCQRATLTHRDGADTITCHGCATVITWDRYRELTGLVTGLVAA